MIARACALAVLICLIPRDAASDGRINFRIDFSRTNVEGAYNDVGLDWQGLEFELEKEFITPKVVLSGFSLGLRRELFYGFTGFGTDKNVSRWDEGTYFVVRLFRTFNLSSDRAWSIGPSVSILYGIPGTTLDRTIVANTGDAGLASTHVFPVRNSDVPKLLADKAALVSDSALLYPEVSFVIRRRFAKGGFVLDWLGGFRIMRFGIVDSQTQADRFEDRRMYIPSVGLRVGFRVF
jgi:hypothetical protein